VIFTPRRDENVAGVVVASRSAVSDHARGSCAADVHRLLSDRKRTKERSCAKEALPSVLHARHVCVAPGLAVLFKVVGRMGWEAVVGYWRSELGALPPDPRSARLSPPAQTDKSMNINSERLAIFNSTHVNIFVFIPSSGTRERDRERGIRKRCAPPAGATFRRPRQPFACSSPSVLTRVRREHGPYGMEHLAAGPKASRSIVCDRPRSTTDLGPTRERTRGTSRRRTPRQRLPETGFRSDGG
jgi:hypothetical protein